MDRHDFPVIGIGASAGGLDAFAQAFWKGCRPTPAWPFVVIQHLDPRQESILVELLTAHRAMEVVQVRDQLRPGPDHIYVIRRTPRVAAQN
jgi:two-component system CheB/CheR fusion protein